VAYRHARKSVTEPLVAGHYCLHEDTRENHDAAGSPADHDWQPRHRLVELRAGNYRDSNSCADDGQIFTLPCWLPASHPCWRLTPRPPGRKITVLSRTDELTGLLALRATNLMLDREIAGCARHSQSVTIIRVDIDDLKVINDR
jgi:GGDEF domain-containing protein